MVFMEMMAFPAAVIDGLVGKKPAQQPPKEDVAHPEEKAMERPIATSVPLSEKDIATWASIAQTSKLHSDNAEQLQQQFKRIVELHLMSDKMGEEFRLNTKTAWDWMENAAIILEKIENNRLDMLAFRDREMKRTQEYFSSMNLLLARKEDELFNLRIETNQAISDIRKKYESATESELGVLRRKVSDYENNPVFDRLESEKSSHETALASVQMAKKKELSDMKAAFEAEIAKMKSEYVAQMLVHKEKADENEKRRIDFEENYNIVNAENKELKADMIGLRSKLKVSESAEAKGDSPPLVPHPEADEAPEKPIKHRRRRKRKVKTL